MASALLAAVAAGGGGGAIVASTAGALGGQDIPGCGEVLLTEPFDDDDFESRGWYDVSGGHISSSEHVAGSPASLECHFANGGSSCSGGTPSRRGFDASESAYLSFHLKFSSNWVGSGKVYHPHMLHLMTNQDDDYVGPAETYLTTYAEVVEGYAQVGLQDSRNVDQGCLLRNDDSFVGCNGSFETYPFSEARSAAACNDLVGPVDRRDCYDAGSYWYSWRGWRSAAEAFGNGPPPFDKDSWHFVEIYYELNDIENGVGVPNGRIRWVQDGQTLIHSDQILFRTGVQPAMAFDQLALLPYIGDGSPVSQRFWIDELTLATARPGPCLVPTFPAWELVLLVALAGAILIAVRPRDAGGEASG